MTPPFEDKGAPQASGEPPPLRRPKPPAKPERRVVDATFDDAIHVEVEPPVAAAPEPEPPLPPQAIVVRPRSASRPDDDGQNPFVTYRLDKLDRAVEKLDDDGTRVESKVDGLAVKVDTLAGELRNQKEGETSRKAFWSFMTVVVTVAGTMFANYMSKPTPPTPAANVVVSEFERELDKECRSKPEVDQVSCFARVYAKTGGARAR